MDIDQDYRLIATIVWTIIIVLSLIIITIRLSRVETCLRHIKEQHEGNATPICCRQQTTLQSQQLPSIELSEEE